MKKMSTGEGVFLLAYIFVVLLPAGALWSAFVLTHLWDWFVVSTFGAPLLSLSSAMGLAVLARMFQSTPEADKKVPDESLGWNIFTLTTKLVIGPFVALALGYIIKVLS